MAEQTRVPNAETWLAAVIKDFRDSLTHGRNVRAPLLLGGSNHALLERGLASLLQKIGVAGDVAAQRAREGIAKLGAAAIQAAMQSQSPWRQLKQVGNQCNPTFQWVLPSELQAQAQARVASGLPLPGRKKNAKQMQGPKQPAAAPVVLQPEQFALPKGVLVSGSPSQELQQLALSEVGSQAVGVVMTTKDLAAPYLSLQKAVSAGPLALLLLGEDERAELAVPSSLPRAGPRVSQLSLKRCWCRLAPGRSRSTSRQKRPRSR